VSYKYGQFVVLAVDVVACIGDICLRFIVSGGMMCGAFISNGVGDNDVCTLEGVASTVTFCGAYAPSEVVHHPDWVI